ncbi:eRF1 domain 1 [uncultured archaeon]|nr:eRF1 domain 1 [uncultured archaeon]
MRVLSRNIKSGYLKFEVENLDDLWFLAQVIQSGDAVKGKTERSIKGKDDMVRSGGGERLTVTLAVSVEEVEFKSEGDTLRIKGKITEGPEDVIALGGHHTFVVEAGTVLSLEKKQWNETEINLIREAEKQAHRPKVAIAVIDEGEATVALIRESKVQYYEVSHTVG